MKLNEAIEVLKTYMEVRRNAFPQNAPDVIREAIDTVVAYCEKPLPTDEQIEQYALENILDDDTVMAFNKIKRWIEGAIWMRDLMKK